MDQEVLIINSDGGARGNPGPGACAFVVQKNGITIGQGAKYLGEVTNNFAEYSGVILALEWLENSSESKNENLGIMFYLDSELVTKQLKGEYKIKSRSLKALFEQVKEGIRQNKLKIDFQHVPRSENKTADFLVNQELDSHSTL